MGFVVERGERPDGPFVRLHGELHEPTVYSDFIGENGRTLYYRVAAVDGQGRARAASQVASAVTRPMTDEELLTSVEEATFRTRRFPRCWKRLDGGQRAMAPPRLPRPLPGIRASVATPRRLALAAEISFPGPLKRRGPRWPCQVG